MIASEIAINTFFDPAFNKIPSILEIPITPESDNEPMLPITPPSEEADTVTNSILSKAVHVISTEATSLSYLSRLYATDPVARNGFVEAVYIISRCLRSNGKIVVCGVGKSGKIGQKLVATFNSLGLMSVFLHPTEAVHGDMGVIRPGDVLLLLTYSGRTPELLNLLSHLPSDTHIVAMTAHSSPDTCPLNNSNPNFILLPAPIHEKEAVSFGVTAPTTSTTVTIALGDALALSIAEHMYEAQGRRTEDVFRSYHPGGAIGMQTTKQKTRLMDLAQVYEDMPIVDEDFDMHPIKVRPMKNSDDVRVVDCVLKALHSSNGWLRLSNGSVITPRRMKNLRKADMKLSVEQAGIAVPRCKWIPLDGKMGVLDAKNWVKEGDLLLVELSGCRYGVLEADDVLSHME